MRYSETLFVKAQPSEHHWWVRGGFAIAAVILGWLAREELTALVGPTELPFIFFFPAVAAASWFGGFQAGLLSAVASAVLANWLFLNSARAAQHIPYNIVATISFLLACLFIIAAIEAMHRTRARLVQETLDRREAEAVRAQAHGLLTTTLASIGDGVIVTDAQSRVNFMNAEAERLTRWTAR